MTGSYHIETSVLICSTNQWNGFYVIESSIMKELLNFDSGCSIRIQNLLIVFRIMVAYQIPHLIIKLKRNYQWFEKALF